MAWLVALVTFAGVALVAWRARRELSRRVLATFVVGAIAWTGYSLTRPAGLFSGDEGVKLVQTYSVAEGQLAMTYPGQAFDPAGRAFPLYAPFVLEHEGEHYGIYATGFTVPSMIGFRLFGWWGLFLVPLVGGLLALWFTLRLALRMFEDDRWAIASAVVLLTTPLALNATFFNEHAFATGLVLFTAATASEPAPGPRPWRLVAAGFALGIAATIRLELVAILPAIAAFTAMTASGVRDTLRRFAWLSLGGTAAVATYVIPNLVTIGELSPALHPTYLKNFGKVGDPILPDLYPVTGVGRTTMVWPFIIGLVPVFGHRVLQRIKTVAILVFAGVMLYSVGRYLSILDDDKKLVLGHVFIATPLCILALAHGFAPRGADPRHRFSAAIWALAIAGTASIWLVNPVDGGLRIGDRYTLPLLPFWVLAGVAVVQRMRLLLVAAIPAVLLGAYAFVIAHGRVQTIRGRNADIVAEVRALGDHHIVSELFWGAQIAAPLWRDHVMLGAPGVNRQVLRAIQATGATTLVDVVGGLQYYKDMLVEEPATRMKLVRRYRFATRR